jgi:hypothetical protein
VAWTTAEFEHELGKDPKRRVLFVEEIRDLAFWKNLISFRERGDTVIYPISELQTDAEVFGGERGRLLMFAKWIQGGPLEERIQFFADADYDRILERVPPDNVIFTDWRDLEAYSLSQQCMSKLALLGLAASETVANDLLSTLCAIARPIAALRVRSERCGWKLPFQKTLIDGNRPARFFEGRRLDTIVDLTRLVEVLLQRAGKSLGQKDVVLAEARQELDDLACHQDRDLIHGKDALLVLARIFDRQPMDIEPLIFLSLDMDEVRQCTNIMRVENWVRQRDEHLK